MAQMSVFSPHVLPQDELAPISVLPVETLQEIFLSCYPPEIDDHQRWRLGLVSRGWRCTALGCTEYWSHIFIRYIRPDTVSMVDTWTKRSMQRPLDITFSDVSRAESITSQLLPLLFQHRLRWRSVDIQVFHEDTLRALEALQAPLPLLQSLTLRVQFQPVLGPLGPDPEPFDIEAFSYRSPNLSRLSFICTFFLPISVPTHQITSLSLDNWSLLDGLTLPNLTHLNILGNFDCSLNTRHAINRFLRRSSCSLKSLGLIFAVAVSWETFQETLQLLIDLECLRIDILWPESHEDVCHEALRTLWGSQTLPILPKLRIFEFNVGGTTSRMVDSHVLYVVENRVKGGGEVAQLEQFTFSTGTHIRHETYNRLKLLNEGGLVVSLGYENFSLESVARKPLRDFTNLREDNDGEWKEWEEWQDDT